MARRFAWLAAVASRPSRGVITLHYETVVPAALDTTFAFFADAANLERLTPPWVHFRIATPMPVVMREGLEIDYRIVVRGLPLGWRSRIDVWAPNRRFVDRQVLGPYRWWHHEHRFEPVGGGTRVIDDVEFLPRLRWVSEPFVRRDVDRIFTYRRTALAAIFSPAPSPQRS